MGDTDKQYTGHLIDEYYRLVDIRKIAEKSNDMPVIEAIDKQLKRIRIKLQPLELPVDD